MLQEHGKSFRRVRWEEISRLDPGAESLIERRRCLICIIHEYFFQSPGAVTMIHCSRSSNTLLTWTILFCGDFANDRSLSTATSLLSSCLSSVKNAGAREIRRDNPNRCVVLIWLLQVPLNQRCESKWWTRFAKPAIFRAVSATGISGMSGHWRINFRQSV